MQKLFEQMGKFAIVGVLAFFIDYGTMLLLTEVFGVNYLVSTTAGFVVSVVFNYLASMRFVFKHKEDLSRRREFVIFVALSVGGLLLNDALMYVGVDLLGIDYRLSKIVVTGIVMVYNFVTRKVLLDAGDDGAESSEHGGGPAAGASDAQSASARDAEGTGAGETASGSEGARQ